jgi:hypothetical protein
VPIDQPDLHDRHPRGHRVDLAVDRHAQRVGCCQTAQPSASAKAAASSSASLFTSSSPTIITGRSAASTRRAIASRIASDGRTRVWTRLEASRSSSASAFSTSPGSDRNTGPVGGVVAIFAARRTIRGRSSSRPTSTAHLTSGSAIRTSGS